MTKVLSQQKHSYISLLYRGSLSSCNYSCGYCPFAKNKMTKAEVAQDASEVHRFSQWVTEYTASQNNMSILFTPWGEGLVHAHYQQAMTELSHLAHIKRVAIQTNLASELSWLQDVNKDTFALWCTYHPSQIPLERFVKKCHQLVGMGVRFSVGMVALREDFDNIKQLKSQLPNSVPMWLNAYDMRTDDYYSAQDVAWLSSIDAHFLENLNPSDSFGKACDAGKNVFSVESNGDVFRCHFLKQQVIANIYDGSFDSYLKRTQNQHAKPCPKQCCDCFIGYVNRPDTQVYDAYKDGRLERVPVAIT